MMDRHRAGAIYMNLDLSKINFAKADLSEANLAKADLRRTAPMRPEMCDGKGCLLRGECGRFTMRPSRGQCYMPSMPNVIGPGDCHLYIYDEGREAWSLTMRFLSSEEDRKDVSLYQELASEDEWRNIRYALPSIFE